jgi:tRNA(Ile)-lysidine synthase
MVAADFYRRGDKRFTLAHFNHQTPHADEFEAFVANYATKHSITFVSATLTGDKPKDQSPEEWWRNERYRWFLSLKDPVVVCQHLNDVAEWWVMSALHGNPKLIPAKRDNILRPFLTNPKGDLYHWANTHDVKFIKDLSNKDTRIPRNWIRWVVLPHCKRINPGLLKTLKKKVIAAYQGDIK